MEVEALITMEHNGRIARGARFVASPQQARELVRKNLVRIIDDAPPTPAIGITSSALPVAQASPQTIVTPSGSGARKKKVEASSS